VDHRWIIRTNGEFSFAKEYIHETLIESGRIGRSGAEATRVAPLKKSAPDAERISLVLIQRAVSIRAPRCFIGAFPRYGNAAGRVGWKGRILIGARERAHGIPSRSGIIRATLTRVSD